MKLYHDLAPWFHLLTTPADYQEEAAVYSALLVERARGEVRRVLELGSGGGNNASHMKMRFDLTLVDVSQEMLEVSRSLNPECEHIRGDMRHLRLAHSFDAVFVHDAVMYMATPEDLQAAMETAARHCRPGGVVLIAPDCVEETFYEYEHRGGHDGEDGRSLRYHERIHDPLTCDHSYRVDFTIHLEHSSGEQETVEDVHEFGLFTVDEWTHRLEVAGLVEVEAIEADLGGDDSPTSYIFVGIKPL